MCHPQNAKNEVDFVKNRVYIAIFTQIFHLYFMLFAIMIWHKRLFNL